MATVQSITIPSPMDERGSMYQFLPRQLIGRNGAGTAVTIPNATLTWRWSTLTPAEFAFWYTTVCQGNPSRAITSAQLYNHLQTLQTFTTGIVYSPTYETFREGMYINVVVTIEALT